MIVLLAVISNCNEWTTIEIFAKSKEKWMREFLELENGIPSIDTIQRVMAIIKPVQLYRVGVSYFVEKLDELVPLSTDEEGKEVDIISLDGKTRNGSSRKQTHKEAISSVNTMSAYSTSYGLALAQEFIPNKTNEIPIAPELIKPLNVANCTFTWAALNTQKETVKAVGNKADYVGALKGNQHLFYQEVKLFFEDETIIRMIMQDGNYLKTMEPEKSGVVTREYFMISGVD